MITCAFTKLPISEGDKVVVIPLKEFKFKSETNHGVTPPVMYENTSDFVPFTLPIIGHYDIVEGLVNIVKDSNTKIIENKYRMSIEDFLSIVFCSRNFNDSLSALFKQFAKNKETFELFYKDKKKYFEHFGFIKEADFIYKHESLKDCLFLINESEYKVTCTRNGNLVFENQLSLEKTLNNISKYFNTELNAREDNVFLNKLKGLSSMIIRYDVYQNFILNKNDFNDYFQEAWMDFNETSNRANKLKNHLLKEVIERLAAKNEKISPGQYEFLLKSAYMMVGASKLGVELRGFENIIIYSDDFHDDLKDKFYQLLKNQFFMYRTGVSYYPNKRLNADELELLNELFEYKLKKIKEYI